MDDKDIDDLLDYGQYGSCVYKQELEWWYYSTRNDVIIYDKAIHASELTKYLYFDDSIDTTIRDAITDITEEYWDYFIKEGTRRIILGYEFGIYTGGSKPVCCHKASYGPYKSKVIMEQIPQLLSNNWIDRYEGPWGSMTVQAQKPHQENIVNIADFI